MQIIKCPSCGKEITIENPNVTLVQCACGAVIPNYAKAYGEKGFDNVVKVDKILGMQEKAVNKITKIMIVVFAFLIVGLSIAAYILYDKVDKEIPIITIIPVIIFLIIAEIITIRKRIQLLKVFKK